jgi:predicted O-methyltransferase YrrM
MSAGRAVSAAIARVAAGLDRIADRHWSAAPLVARPAAGRDEYLRLADEVKARRYPEIDAYEREAGYAVDPAWLHALALHTQITKKKSELCYQHGRVLYAALRQYLAEQGGGSVRILETGTARGFSSLCMAKALADAGAEGTIFTYDVLPHEASILWNCVDDHEGPRTRAELLAPWAELVERYLVFAQGDSVRSLPRLRVPRVNFAFLDGHHTYPYVMREFEWLRPRQRPGDVVVFDDYTDDFPGVIQAVDEICDRFGYDRHVVRSLDRRAYVVARRQ